MALIIRKATAEDAAAWQGLLKEALGNDEVAEQVYDLNRVSSQLTGSQVEETWVADVSGKLHASISILASDTPNANPVANLGRYLALPEAYLDGSAEALVDGINEVCLRRRQMAILRIAASDQAQQVLFEKSGYVCAGFQPFKHLCMVREGVLFYVRTGAVTPVKRLPFSQSLPQVNGLAAAVLGNLQISTPAVLRDGLTGYPLHTELQIEERPPAAYEAGKLDAQASHPPVEISGHFNRGLGVLRVGSNTPIRSLLARRGEDVVAGLCFYFDDRDKCMRLVDSFATDELSAGALLRRAVNVARDELNAVYVEVDFLISAPRALKSAELLGFVPVAFLPGFYVHEDSGIDLVKMVKLNATCSLDNVKLTPHSRAIVDLVDRSFQDQKVGVAVINLLRGLPVFEGLGDGELAKLARLFTQKLYRPGERVFGKGDSSNEAYVVMRGQIDIFLDEDSAPVASISSGAIIGEQAFLDGTERTAIGLAAQPSILLIVQRAAFNSLVQHEPHLGMAVMRNIAIDVSNKLRKADVLMALANG